MVKPSMPLKEDDGTSIYQKWAQLLSVLEIKVEDAKLWFIDEQDGDCR